MINKDAGFMDEKIIELIREKEKELEQKSEEERIRQGVQAGLVIINGEGIEFEEKSLLDDRIKMRLPKNFKVMSPEIASLKYPYEKKPYPIFTNETATKNISFNYTDGGVSEKEIGGFRDSMRLVLERLQPSAVWLEDGIMELNGKKLSFFEFISQALDANLYNLMFFAELDGKALICAVNCVEEEMEDWMPVARGMMSSFKVCGTVK